ncbi:MAG: hypothetical protein ACR2F1_03155 [Nitrososphaeraceae archaeon]
MFKYLNDKRSSLVNRNNNRYSHSDSSSISFHPRRRIYQGFFIKPHLNIRGLTYETTKCLVESQLNRDNFPKHEFEPRVWKIKITNGSKFSKNIAKCTPKLYFDLIKTEVNLHWNIINSNPFNYVIPTHYDSDIKDKTIREIFLREVGFQHTLEIYSTYRSRETIDIPTGSSGEVYFLITFRELNFAYLIIENRVDDSYYENSSKFIVPTYNGVLSILQFHKEYEFQLRFEGDGYYEEKGRKFKIKINSWDNIELK